MAFPPFFRDIDGLPSWLNALGFVLLTALIMVGIFANELGGIIFVGLSIAWLGYGLWEIFWPKPK